MLENILAANFIYFRSKGANLRIQFSVLPWFSLGSKKSLKINVLISQVFHIFFGIFQLFSCLWVHLLTKIQVQIDQSSLIVLEFIKFGVNSIFSILQFIVKFFNPFCQDSQNCSIMRFEDWPLDLLFRK